MDLTTDFLNSYSIGAALKSQYICENGFTSQNTTFETNCFYVMFALVVAFAEARAPVLQFFWPALLLPSLLVFVVVEEGLSGRPRPGVLLRFKYC